MKIDSILTALISSGKFAKMQPSELKLFVYLLHQFEQSGFPKQLTVSNQTVMRESGISSKTTLNRLRNDLIQHGLIFAVHGLNGIPSTVYSIDCGPTSGTEGPTSGTEGPTSGTEGPTSGTEGPTSGTEGPTSGTEGPTSGTPERVSSISQKTSLASLDSLARLASLDIKEILKEKFPNVTDEEADDLVGTAKHFQVEPELMKAYVAKAAAANARSPVKYIKAIIKDELTNAKPKKRTKAVSAQQYQQRDYTEDELEAVSMDWIEEAKRMRDAKK